MVNTKFEAYKLRRELKRIGIEFEFTRATLNDFKEPTNDHSVAGKLLGLYHESNSYVSKTIENTANTGGSVQVRTKKIPMILCLYDDAKFLKIGDVVKFNSKTYKVNGVVNIQEWNIISDISLEVVDDGIHA